MARIKLGDVFQIETPKGKAYLHYIYKDKTIGHLIRVLPNIFKVQPDNLDDLVKETELFMVFFPLAAAFKQKRISLVSNCALENMTKPQYMREKHFIRGELLGWHIVNTDSWQIQLVKNLTEEQRKMSPWGIWNDTLLVERLVEGWTLDNWS